MNLADFMNSPRFSEGPRFDQVNVPDYYKKSQKKSINGKTPFPTTNENRKGTFKTPYSVFWLVRQKNHRNCDNILAIPKKIRNWNFWKQKKLTTFLSTAKPKLWCIRIFFKMSPFKYIERC